MKSARINFGIGAESEYVLEVGDTGVATRCFNPVTGQELGIGGGDATVIIVDNGTALDKTFAEIYDLIESGTPCYISYTGHKSTGGLDTDYSYFVDLMPIVNLFKYDNNYRLVAYDTAYAQVDSESVGCPCLWTYSANTSSEHPVFLRRTYVDATYLATANARD